MDGVQKQVQIIKATKGLDDTGKIRVAAYCRVSTDKEDQVNSFMAQMQYYNDYIKNNQNMILVDIYADEGISGTSISRREDFQRLLKDCDNRKIDRVLVKSVTRFARNSLECLESVRRMQNSGVSVFFETDNIDTKYMNSELLLYIKSAFAQSESINHSVRTSMSLRMRMEEGTYMLSHAPYGYRIIDKQLVVEPYEAETVQQIFNWYLCGKGSAMITELLKQRDGDSLWNTTKVRYILSNEKYIGDSMMQKTYTPPILPLRNIPNNGERTKYYLENTHEAIIDRDVFNKVQRILQRKQETAIATHDRKDKITFPVDIYCRHCQRKFSPKSCSPHLTACSKKGNYGTVCASRSYSREELNSAFVRMYNILRKNEKILLNETIAKLQTVKNKLTAQNEQVAGIDSEIAMLSEQCTMYAKLMADNIIDQVTYTEKSDSIKRKITDLRNKRRKLLSEDEDERCIEDIRSLQRLLEGMPERILVPEDDMIKTIVQKIYAEEDGALSFIVIGGLEFRVEMKEVWH